MGNIFTRPHVTPLAFATEGTLTGLLAEAERCFRKCSFRRSKQLAKQALQIASALGCGVDTVGRTLYLLGDAYWRLSKYSKANRAFLRAAAQGFPGAAQRAFEAQQAKASRGVFQRLGCGLTGAAYTGL